MKLFPSISLVALLILIISVSNAQLIPVGKTAFKTQLHLHALSNHNGANNPASVQYQNFMADTFSTSVIWWTEHYEFLKQNENRYFIFKNGTVDTLRSIYGLSSSSGQPDSWQAAYTANSTTTTLTDSSLSVCINASTGVTGFRYISYTPRVSLEPLHTCDNFVKPLTSIPFFEFYITPNNLKSKNAAIKLIFTMAYHHRNGISTQNVIVCSFVDSSVAATSALVTTDTAFITIPVYNNIAQKITLPLATYASLFSDSTDNVIQDYQIKLESKNGKYLKAKFDRMKIYTVDPTDQVNFNNVSALLNKYTALGKKNYFGIEFTGSHGNYDHLTCYLPLTNPTYTDIIASGITNSNHLGYSNFIKNKNGVVCYTHPFGSTSNANFSASKQDYRLDTLFTYLVNNNLYGAQIMEVGYKSRGSADLAHHVSLWDRLTAHKIYLYGVGSSDRHGDDWGSRFITWIWSDSITQPRLIDNIKTGRMFFAVTNMWSGNFNFTIGNQTMGDRVNGYYKNQYLKTYMSPVVSGMKLKLTQGLLDSTTNVVTYIVKDSVININDSVKINLTQPSFVRLTVYNSSGEAFLFSNPIIYKTAGTYAIDPQPGQLRTETKCFTVKSQPNPFESELQIVINSCHSGHLKIEIENMNGRHVKSCYNGELNENDMVLNVATDDLAKGTYILKAALGREVVTEKIIKQ